MAIAAPRNAQEGLCEFLQGLDCKEALLDDIIVIYLEKDRDEGQDKLADLSRSTSLSIIECNSGIKLQAGNLYLMPSDSSISIEQYVLSISKSGIPNADHGGHSRFVDEFFISLAQNHAPHAVGILLGAVGGDGIKGLLTLQNAGAWTLSHASQPKCWDSRAVVDDQEEYLLKPRVMGEKLASQLSHKKVNFQQSEEMLRKSLLAANMDAFHLDFSDRQMLRQGGLSRQLGVPESLENEEYLVRIHSGDRLERDRAIAFCTPDQSHYRNTYRFTKSDGQVCWLSEEGEIQFDHAGNKVALSGICRDVTGERHREEGLLAKAREAINQEERLRRVIDHQLGLVGIIDLDGTLLEVDNTSMSITGTSREQVIGKHFAETSFWSHDKATSQRIREAMQHAFEGEVVRFDVALASTNDRTLMIDFMLAPLYDEQGAVEFLIPSGVDISERKQAEQALLASENRLRVGVAVANLALAEIDYLSNTAHLTKEAAQLYGLDESVSCVNREQLYTFIHEDDRARVHALIDRQLASSDGDSIHCQHRLQFSDGSLRWVEVRMQFYFKNVHGSRQPYKSILAARDITEQKSADGRLLESENRFRNMIDDLPNLIWVHDVKGQLQTVNRTFREFFGAELTCANGQDWRELIHPDDVDEYTREFDVCVRERRVFRAQARVRNAEGQWRWLESVGLPRLSDTGEFLGFAGSSGDVTKQHEFENSLRKARRAAEVANESKSAFIANMSHEIRTPMSAVLGYTELLGMEEKDPEKLEFLSIIRRNGHFLLDIINDILDLSKVEAGKLDIDNTSFAVQDIVTDVLSMMKARASEKNLSFNVEYRTDIPATINSDPRRLQQILVNLIGNAVKFTEEGGVQLLVTYGQEDGSRLHFSVVDSGIGMSSEIQTRLFTPFSQGDDSVSRLFGGTGLGLAISQRLARLLGGEIVVDSETGRGSCFSFTIAVGDVSAQPLITVNSDYAVMVEEPAANDIKLDCCVLVVDDQRDVRVMVKRFLEKASATVCTAEDGIDALSLVRESMEAGSPLIDLVLLDMQMPRLDGYNTARQLRGMGFKAPIVALTADALQADMTICLTSGCDAYLSKPVNSRDLLTTIKHYTQQIEPAALEDQRRRVAASADKAGNGTGAIGSLPDERSGELAEGSTGLQVLIVDAVDVCRSLQRLLERKGIRADCAHDGKSALQRLCDLRPNVVILDINLPDMSGLELVKLMRAQLDSPDTRFIALSGHTGSENFQRSLAAGFDTHLEKPVDIKELLAAIRIGRVD
ncbi:response regulator [Granulosicoccus antarcticus]|uniref:response regulator n=1 Tax=Granulosicoccus antarcticus TaxID=437505 RepID=UPI00197AE7BA|nr:response regulator [Granulosicoccus antarcticus]